ncbi:anti-sigma factor domain-containing protein [Clostridium sp. B9]|uniref:anti-sigma factor domain-containing protein n=1 Tax=Clostridium sp. B9 TaxID=3423224 RepID=UPI003D2F3C18
MNTILKGIIVEIKDDYIIALKNTGDMVRLKNKGSCEIGDSIMFFSEDIIELDSKNKASGKVIPFKRFVMPIAAIAAIFVIFFSNIVNILLPTKGYAVVSMDINPSLQLELSHDEKILKVKSLNKDAEKLFDSVKGMELKAGMEEIRDILLTNNYNLDNSDMLVGFTFINGNDNKEYEDRVQRTIKEVFKTSNVAYMKGTEKELKEAEKKGISLGRYEAEIDLDDLDLDDDDVSFIIEQLKKGKKIKFLNDDDLDELEDLLEEDSEDDLDNDDDLEDDSKLESNDSDDYDDPEENKMDEKNDDYEDDFDDITPQHEEEEPIEYEEAEDSIEVEESYESDDSDDSKEDDSGSDDLEESDD